MNNVQQLAEAYERDGCVRVRGLLPAPLLAEVRGALGRYLHDVVPTLPAGDRTLEADQTTVRNLWRMQEHDPFFKALAERPEIRTLVAKLVHGEPVLMAVETFNKPARVGSGVPPHQDNAYFCQTPPDALTIWIAIDAATLENGPIYYLKGSHRLGVLPHRPSGVAGNSMGLAEMPARTGDKTDEFCGTLEAGDAMIHHSQTIHWSAPNKTDRPRCGLLLVYRGAHTQHDPALKVAYDAARAGAAAAAPVGT
jgi:ectoine hydroxylase-related dioxygenase (phytanoyl-CoA dioxygenase family)